MAILGPRQVGKTTLAKRIAAGRPSLYLYLQDSAHVAKLTNPKEFLAAHLDKLVIIDEIQRRPELFSELRGTIDEARRQGHGAGRYLILGSASHHLLRQSSESLAGRIVYTELTPLQVLEVPAADLEALLVRGGFPDSFTAETDQRSMDWRKGFIRSYLERDIKDVAPGVSSTLLERFWTMLAYAQGAEWNGAKLAAGLGVSGHAVARYRDLLSDLLLVRQLQPWSGNVRTPLRRPPRNSTLSHAVGHLSFAGNPAGGPEKRAAREGQAPRNSIAPAAALPQTNRQQWSKNSSRRYGKAISDKADRATSWDDLEMAFAEDGFSLQSKGKGLAVGNARSYTKFSALGLTTSAKDLEQRFGTPRPRWRPFDYSNRRKLFAVDAVDITRFLAMYGLATKDDISDAIDEASTNRAKQFSDDHQTSYMTRLVPSAIHNPHRPHTTQHFAH